MIQIDIQKITHNGKVGYVPTCNITGNNSYTLTELATFIFMLKAGLFVESFTTALSDLLTDDQITKLISIIEQMGSQAINENVVDGSVLQSAKTPIVQPDQGSVDE